MKRSRFWFAPLLTLCVGCDPRGPAITLATPENPTYTHDTVPVQLQVSGWPDQVELLLDGTALTTLSAPYTYDWDTRSLPEGTYVLTARARFGKAELFSLGHKVIVDRTPPQLVQHTPATNEFNLSVHAPIEARFSEAMHLDSINGDTIRLERDGSAVESMLSLTEEGTVLHVVPSSLTAPASVRVKLMGITDLAGNELVQPEKDWTWDLTGLVRMNKPPPPGVAYFAAQAMALNPSGEPVVAWLYGAGHYLFRWNGEAWEATAPQVLGRAQTYPPNFSNASLQFDATGRPVLAWFQSWGTPHSGIREGFNVKRWTGSVWEDLGVSSLTTAVASVRLDATGAPVVPWVDRKTNTLSLQRGQDGAWSMMGEPLPVGGAQLDAFRPSIEARFRSGKDGTLAMALLEPAVTANDYLLRVRRWTGATWEPVGAHLWEGRELPWTIALELDAAGLPVIAWTEGSTLRVQRFEEGAWKPLANVEGVLAVSAIRMDASDKPFLAVVKRAKDNTEVVHVLRWEGSAWLDVSGPLKDPGLSHEMLPALELDPQGNPIVMRTWLWVPNR